MKWINIGQSVSHKVREYVVVKDRHGEIFRTDQITTGDCIIDLPPCNNKYVKYPVRDDLQ